MPIVAGDLKYRYTGAASHNAAQADPDASLGGFRASTDVTGGDNNLFDDVSGDESSTGDTEYRAVGFLNSHGSLPLTAGKVWISVDTGNAEDDISFGVETPSPSETTGSIQTIANESTAPSAIFLGCHHKGDRVGLSGWRRRCSSRRLVWGLATSSHLCCCSCCNFLGGYYPTSEE